MQIRNLIFGRDTEKMQLWVFRFMEILFGVYYFFWPASAYIRKFGIVPGMKVVDYGCGPGHFIRSASELAGKNGHVFAVDIHELAIESVKKIIRKYDLKNVTPVHADELNSGLQDGIADLVFVIDMFHMVVDPSAFLHELRRISSKNGALILEDGHQPRKKTIDKIKNAGCWQIAETNKRFLRCLPV